MAKTNIASKAVSQSVSSLPKYVVDNHPKFASFMKAYYSWSASQGPDLAMEVLKLQNDIDLVPDVLLDGYKKSYAEGFPLQTQVDFRHFAKFLKEFYQLKGTPESFRIFYRLVFGVDAEVFYPKTQMFIPSDAIWYNEVSFRASVLTGNPLNLISKEVTGKTNGFTAIVSNVNKISDVEYEVIIEESNGKFIIGETIFLGGDSLTVLPIYTIVSYASQSSWYDASIITLPLDGISLKVDKINYGKIVSLVINSTGTGYAVDDILTSETEFQGTGFNAKVTSVNGTGGITGYVILNAGFGFNSNYVTIKPISKSCF
jgi:hypothetical protein